MGQVLYQVCVFGSKFRAISGGSVRPGYGLLCRKDAVSVHRGVVQCACFMSYATDFILGAVGGYLVGSISFSILIARIMRLPDPRTVGSGNPGATNVARSSSRAGGALTLVGDVLKGLLVTASALYFGFPVWAVAAAAFAVYLGHLFPLYHGFRGGKGVATLFGCLAAISWQSALLSGGIWLFTLWLSRYVSLASMVAVVAAPILLGWAAQPIVLVMVVALMSTLTVVRHHDNIRRLLNGRESKVGKRA